MTNILVIGRTHRSAAVLARDANIAGVAPRRTRLASALDADQALRGFRGRVIVQPGVASEHGLEHARRLEHYLRLAQKRGARVEYSDGTPFEVA